MPTGPCILGSIADIYRWIQHEARHLRDTGKVELKDKVLEMKKTRRGLLWPPYMVAAKFNFFYSFIKAGMIENNDMNTGCTFFEALVPFAEIEEPLDETREKLLSEIFIMVDKENPGPDVFIVSIHSLEYDTREATKEQSKLLRDPKPRPPDHPGMEYL